MKTPAHSDVQEFACGGGAGLINILVTFPINKVMFRQMVHGMETKYAVQQLRKEGLRYLYRGCLPPLMQKTVSVSIMFGTFQKFRKIIERHFPTVSPFTAIAAASLLAGTSEAILTPFERVQTLLQDKKYHSRFQNTGHAFRELKKFGVREYYRGLTLILLRNGPSNILFFSLRGEVRNLLPSGETWWHHYVNDFISGALIGAAISTVFYPLNVVKTVMQIRYDCNFLTVHEAWNIVYNERGRSLRKIFYGVHINYTRALLSWGIINASYELLKKNFFVKEYEFCKL